MPDAILRIRVTALTDDALSSVKEYIAYSLSAVNAGGCKAIAELMPDAEPRGPRDALTPAQVRVADALATGAGNKEIARALGITEGTVKGHVGALMRKTGAASRTAFALDWLKRKQDVAQ